MTDDGRLLTDPAALPPAEAFPTRRPFSGMLFATPGRFRVDYEINPYMEPGVDAERAREQWHELVETYRRFADVSVLDVEATRAAADGQAPPADRPDVVFCANLGLALPDGRFLLARMATDQRRGEPAYLRRWAASTDRSVERLRSDAVFEGAGDARWHPGRRLLWGGHGPRTDRAALEEIAARFDVPVVPLELTDESFYHLDVCFAALDERTALACPAAFTDAGLAKIRALFETCIEVPAAAARDGLACNCHAVGDGRVVIDEANEATAARLADHGYEPVRVSTDEFRKGGGSVACLGLPH